MEQQMVYHHQIHGKQPQEINARISFYLLHTLSFLKKAPPLWGGGAGGFASYRYFFIPSEAAAGSAEMVMVISMLFSLAKSATQSTKASLAA